MTRGDLVTIADKAGEFTGKPRPAIVVQSDLFEDLETVAVCPVTSVGRQGAARVQLDRSESVPLLRPSWIEVDKLTTIRRQRVGKVIGKLHAAELQRLNEAMLVFLGIG